MRKLALIAVLSSACSQAPAPPALPDLDTAAMEPLVRETIERALAATAAAPADAEAWAQLGFVLDAHQLLPQAGVALDHAVALGDESFAALYTHAVVGALLGLEPAAVLDRYDAALALREDYAPLHVRRGDALNQMGRAEEALAAFDRALSLDPSSLLAAASKARAWIDQGQAEQALPLLRRVTAAAPDDQPSMAALARALTLVGQVEEGREASARAQQLEGSTLPVVDPVRAKILDLGRNSWANYQRYQRKLEAGDVRAAERWLKEVAAAQPGDFRVLIELAQLQMTLFKLDEARGHLERVLTGFPEHPGAHALLGQLEVIEGNAAEGLSHLEEAGRLAGRLGPSTHLSWASALATFGRWQEAADQYAIAADLMPGNAEPLFQQAMALVEAGRPEMARSAYQAALVLNPGHPLARQVQQRLQR